MGSPGACFDVAGRENRRSWLYYQIHGLGYEHITYSLLLSA